MKTTTRHTMRAAIAGLALLAAFSFSGCNSTQVESTWTAPGTTKLAFRNVLVVMLHPDGATRRLAEDTICAQMPYVQSTASYTLFPDNQALKSGAAVHATLNKYNFDGAIIVRLVSKDTEVNSTGGTGPVGPYRSFWGAWGAAGWGGAWAGDIQTDTIIGLETNVYEMGGDKIVYSAVTKTTNPQDTKDLLTSAAKALTTALQNQGLIQPAK